MSAELPSSLSSLLFLALLVASVWSEREEYGVVRRVATFRHDDKVQYSISAFGKEMLFNFTRNKEMVHPGFKIKTKSGFKAINVKNHFIYESPTFIASISDYGKGEIYGFVSGKGKTIEIHPLNDHLQSILRNNPYAPFSFDKFRNREIFRLREVNLPALQEDEYTTNEVKKLNLSNTGFRNFDRRKKGLTIELAVFVDHEAYRELMRLYESDYKVFHVLLAHVNQVYALFKMRSLEVNVDLSLTKLEILENRELFSKYEGERNHLLKSFCEYQYAINEPGDKNPNHWDMGVLLTGLDLWSISKSKERDYSTLGIAPTGGMCSGPHSCAIAELRGSMSEENGNTISSGFAASYVMAHEIGHVLGLPHDGHGNDCSSNGYIMSSIRSVQGESKWSHCSGEILKIRQERLSCLFDTPGLSKANLERKYKGIPGFFIKSDKQCQLFLRDRQSFAAVPQGNICESLLCSTDDGSTYDVGPPLTGTYCKSNHWCKSEKCIERPKWSKWAHGTCKSGCLQSSMGIQILKRKCLSGSNCIGPSIKTQLCDDNRYCEKKSAQRTITFISRKSRMIYANKQCRKHAARKSNFLLRSGGKAGGVTKYDKAHPERACIIYCRSRDKGWISPSPTSDKEDFYFPDGTWCNYNDKTGQHYYCIRHKCVPQRERRKRRLT